MSGQPLLLTIIFALAGVAFIIIDIIYYTKQQNKQSTPLQNFVEDTINDIENAARNISAKNGRVYHVRGSTDRKGTGVFGDIDFDISLSIGKNNQVSISNVETGIGASLQEKTKSTQRIKFGLSSSRKNEIHEGINQ